MKITETSSNRPKRLKTSITELDACISIATGLRFFFFFLKPRSQFSTRAFHASRGDNKRVWEPRWFELEKFFSLIASLLVIISDTRCSRWNLLKVVHFFFYYYYETLKLSGSWKYANEQNISYNI